MFIESAEVVVLLDAAVGSGSTWPLRPTSLANAREREHVPVGVEAVRHVVSPAARGERAQFRRAVPEGTCVVHRGIVDQDVELRPRHAVRRTRIGKCVTQQPTDPLDGHESQHCSASQPELGHAGNVEIGPPIEDARVELAARALIKDVEDEVSRRDHTRA